MRQLLVALLLLTACSIQSCKEGCKDKTALNYDSKATAENGTCMYCKDSYVADTATYFFTNFNSSNQNSPAIEFIVVNTNASISGNGCQSIGKQAGSGCKNYLTMVNLTSQHVDGFLSVEFSQNGTDQWFFETNGPYELGPPGSGTDTMKFGLVDSVACSNLTTGTLSSDIGNLQFF